MPELSYLKIFLDWTEVTRKLKDQEKGRLIDALVAYAKGDEDVDSRLTGNEVYVFPMFKLQIDRDNSAYSSRCESWRENGKKGGRPKKQKQSEENPKNQKVFSETKKRQDKDKEKEKEKDEEGNPPLSPLAPAEALAFSDSPELQAAFDDWLAYKRERREEYKPTGLKSLVTEIRKNADRYGSRAVADLIRECMASNWRGIIFDRLKAQTRNGGGWSFDDI